MAGFFKILIGGGVLGISIVGLQFTDERFMMSGFLLLSAPTLVLGLYDFARAHHIDQMLAGFLLLVLAGLAQLAVAIYLLSFQRTTEASLAICGATLCFSLSVWICVAFFRMSR